MADDRHVAVTSATPAMRVSKIPLAVARHAEGIVAATWRASTLDLERYRGPQGIPFER
jgi:hypothetical protein